MKLEDIKKAAVIGAGAMGHGITEVCITAGIEVTMSDIKQEFLDKGVARIKKNFKYQIEKEKISQEHADKALSNLKTSTNIKEAVSDVQLVIEAVPELFDLKQSIFKEVSDSAPEDAILATNTSTMSITDLATVVKNPGRFVGMHFFNPVNRMKLVEVTYGEKTSDQAVNLLWQISEKIKKLPVKVLKDRPGFIVNRINAPTQPLLCAILDEGKIKPDAIDNDQKKQGMKMGAFELLDYVGLDIVYNAMKYYEKTLSPDWKPGKYLSDKIKKKELGYKTGKGIYDWSSGRPDIDASAGTTEITPLDFVAVLLNEAIKVYKEGIAESIDDIDRAQVAGMNAGAGPFALASGMDHKDIAASLNKLSDRFGLSVLKPEPEILDNSFREFTKK